MKRKKTPALDFSGLELEKQIENGETIVEEFITTEKKD